VPVFQAAAVHSKAPVPPGQTWAVPVADALVSSCGMASDQRPLGLREHLDDAASAFSTSCLLDTLASST
jgi:hypothetical protein